MTDTEYRERTEQRIDSLMEVIEEQKAQIDNLQKQLSLQVVDQNLDPLLDAISVMADLYRVKFTTLPGNTQRVITAYDKYVSLLQQDEQEPTI